MWGCTIQYIKIYQYIEQYTEREIQLLLFIYIYIHIEREIDVCIYSFIPFGLEFSSSNWIWPSYQIHLPDGAVPLSPLSLLLYMIVMITILWKILGTVLYIAASSSINIRKIPPLLSAPDVPPMAWMSLYPC